MKYPVPRPAATSSTADPEDAPARLMRALAAIDARDPKGTVGPQMRELLARAGEHGGGLTGAVLRSPPLVDSVVRRRLMANPLTAATISNTVHVTGFGGSKAPNVVPSEVWATLDCRLLPGAHADELLAELEGRVAGVGGVRFEVISEGAVTESPVDDPLFRSVARALVRHRPDAVVGPVISVGSTDSSYFRAKGVHAYGIAPVVVTTHEAQGMHGDNERISMENVRDGTRDMFTIVADFAGVGPRADATRR